MCCAYFAGISLATATSWAKRLLCDASKLPLAACGRLTIELRILEPNLLARSSKHRPHVYRFVKSNLGFDTIQVSRFPGLLSQD